MSLEQKRLNNENFSDMVLTSQFKQLELEAIEAITTLNVPDKNLNLAEKHPDYFVNSETSSVMMAESGYHRLLEKEEEYDLGKSVQEGISAQDKLEKKGSEISEKERQRLEKMVKDGNEAGDELFWHNQRLVFGLAIKYYKLSGTKRLPLEDLIQEGRLGLKRAIPKYNPDLNWKFSTYATWWIRQAITRALSVKGRNIRLPVHVGDRIYKARAAMSTLTQKIGSTPTLEQLAQAIGMSPNSLRNLILDTRDTVSLEAQLNDDDDDDYTLETVTADHAPSLEEEVETLELQEKVRAVLEKLVPKYRIILELRYGIYSNKPLTLEQVARLFGCTRERVRQIQEQALSAFLTSGGRKFYDYIK